MLLTTGSVSVASEDVRPRKRRLKFTLLKRLLPCGAFEAGVRRGFKLEA